MGLKSVILASLSIFILGATQTAPKDTLLAVLSAQSELTSLSSLVNSLPPLVQQLNVADNFTFLAPTNAAVSSWLTVNRTQEYIQASLQYHLLNGTYPSASISGTQIFIPSALTNVSYCNVTGGQRVKAYNDGHLVFGSALNTISNAVTVDIIPFGGVIHTIDKVLELPRGALDTFTAENLSYALALSNIAGFLSGESRPGVDAFFDIRNATYFVANSAKTLRFNATGLNETRLDWLVEYDLVPQLLYSNGLVNGSQIMTAAGVPVFVTVHGPDTYINSAKITSKDNFITNGVFHVIDDLLDPGNITLPSFPASTLSPTSQPANISKGISTGAKAGIGIGAAIGFILLIALASICLCRRRRNSSPVSERNPDVWATRSQRKPEELSSNPWHDRAQLETVESAIELPAGYGSH